MGSMGGLAQIFLCSSPWSMCGQKEKWRTGKTKQQNPKDKKNTKSIAKSITYNTPKYLR